MYYYHISMEDLDGKTLFPRIPESMADSEDRVTPRICFCTSIEKCISALSQTGIIYGTTFNVYIIDKPTAVAIVNPTRDQVYDVELTGEVWALEPVTLRKVAEVTVYERIDMLPSQNMFYGTEDDMEKNILTEKNFVECPIYNFSVRYIQGKDTAIVRMDKIGEKSVKYTTNIDGTISEATFTEGEYQDEEG